MSDYDIHTAVIEARGTPLIMLVITTEGVGMQACDPMLVLPVEDQERLMALLPDALREFADALDARSGLGEGGS